MNNPFALFVTALATLVAPAAAQQIVAQSSGIPSPSYVIDFGANLYPNFTPITTQFAGITVTHSRYFTTGTSNNLVGGFLTNDPIGPPNTMTVHFASPITGLSFVYHQIATNGPSTIRAMLQGVTVSSFSGTWNQYQTNNYFGFQNLLFDELQIDFQADFNLDTLAVVDQGAACTTANGTGVNPANFTCAALPVLGGTWVGQIATNPNTVLTMLGYAPAGLATPTPLFGGELLLQQSPPPIGLFGFGTYSISIPAASSWIGTTLVFQGFELRSVGPGTNIIPLNANVLRLGL
ncbi:MAG: hypothetical protein U1E73_09135 [Planctomycetota bacterium]